MSVPSASTSIAAPHKPRVSIFLATACGLGYLPKAPGTWGSLGGLVLAVICYIFSVRSSTLADTHLLLFSIGDRSDAFHSYLLVMLCVTIVIALLGVRVAGRAAKFWGEEDPQRVVIDEVSGQHIALLLGSALPVWPKAIPGFARSSFWSLLAHDRALNWKYLVVGFILFRAFDIWKPFPARQAESLHGGWGIMSDDWIAGIYAALGLWAGRALGL